MLYKSLIRPFLFMLNPEQSQHTALSVLKALSYIPLERNFVRLTHKVSSPALSREVFGIKFPNPVGLSAGMDVDAECYNPLSDFGFGFIEIGSLTATPDSGNPKPRVFRLVKDRAIISRLGVRNKGVSHAIANLHRSRPDCLIAASLAQHPSCTKDEEIIAEFQKSFSLMYDFVDFFTINISCRNEDGLMALQNAQSLADILDPILQLRMCYEKYKPIVIKVSHDIPRSELEAILDFCMISGVDGIIAGNSTRIRGELASSSKILDRIGQGGLSGAPLHAQNIELVKYIRDYTKGRFPIIASGGIMSPQDAAELLDAGASLIQMYSALVFEGPSIVKKTLRYLETRQLQ